LGLICGDGGSADIRTPRDFGFADSLAEEFSDFGGFHYRWGGSAETRAALPGMVQAGTDTFAQDVELNGILHATTSAHKYG
jgi:hypothetical protein